MTKWRHGKDRRRTCDCGTEFLATTDTALHCSTACKHRARNAEMDAKVLALKTEQPGLSYADIACRLGVTSQIVIYTVTRLRNLGALPHPENNYPESAGKVGEVVVKVTRNVMRYWEPATIKLQYGSPEKQFLADEAKAMLGGDAVAYVEAEKQKGKWLFIKRVPTPKEPW